MAIKAAIIGTFLGFSSVKFYVPSDTSIEYNITHYSCDNLHTNTNNTIISGVFLLDSFSIHTPKYLASFALFGTFLEKYGKKLFKKEILTGKTVLILFGLFSSLGGNKTRKVKSKEIFIFSQVER